MAALTAQVHQFTQWVGELQHSKSNRSSSRSFLQERKSGSRSSPLRQRHRRSRCNKCTRHGGSGQPKRCTRTPWCTPLENRDPSSWEAVVMFWKCDEN